jgi:fatty acid desaturase
MIPTPVGSARSPTLDYSLTGLNAHLAIEKGLAEADWYQTPVPRETMRKLLERRDGPAIRDTIIWFTLLGITAYATYRLWGTWWAILPYFIYATLYSQTSDSRWHEAGHGTAFKTRWMADALYQVASFMVLRRPTVWRWSHSRHHTDTIIVGRDAEIAVMRPPDLARTIANFVGIFDAWYSMKALLTNAFGILTPAEKSFIPEMEQSRAIAAARVHIAIYAATIALAVALGSWLPLMLIGLPRLYGAWHMVMVGLLQHGGLADNVTDHRLNTRTVYMNPVSRYLYLNMNYHVEHHMFPMVPYHALPRLHELIKHDLPVPNPSIWHAYREMIPAFLRQLRNEDYFLKRELPPTARPYREEFHTPASLPAAAE